MSAVRLFFLSLIVTVVFLMTAVIALEPYGASVNQAKTGTAPADSAGSHDAGAGNVTELTVTGYSTTQSWQGYYGNVTGVIQLADANDNVMYNWTQVTADGEIYAANQSSVSWLNIECFNFTSTTELNLTDLESDLNISADDVDGVDETFNLNNHAPFDVGSISFNSGQCNNTQIFDNTGSGTFDEVLLYDSSTDIVVFASILSDDTTGFDSVSHDFEMLVLEDGHNGDTQTTTYYFYIELNA